MNRSLSWTLAGMICLVGFLSLAYLFRTPILLEVIALNGAPPLTDPELIETGANERWFDDFYTVEKLSEGTYAISEPRYFRDVYSYLIVGEREALLIDSGSPVRDISPVVERLTDKPVSVIATHLHFDHVGNHDKFENVLMPDLPHLKARVAGGRFVPEPDEHLARVEGYEIEGWQVSRWWRPGDMIDLGGRALTLISTPGHTPDSISIWEPDRALLFMGDFSGDGEIYAFMPNTSLRAYLEISAMLVELLPSPTLLYAAHGAANFPQAPVTGMQSLIDLRDTLGALRDGELASSGFWPHSYRVNENTIILTDWAGPGTRSWDFQ